MKDEVTKAREKFIEDMQKMGFPVKIQGGKALIQRQQDEGGWPSKQKDRDTSSMDDEAE